MKSSTDRILTTHTGSLPRSKALSAMLVKREQRKPYDTAAFRAEIERNLDDNIRRQVESGVAIGNDGETPRVGFSTYTTERMTGLGGESRRKPTLDAIKFPGFAEYMSRQIGVADDLAKVWNAPQAVGRLEYDPTLKEAKDEAALFQASLKRVGAEFVENFMSAASPGIVSTTMLLSPNNPAYKNDAEYVMGIARELKKE
jgi:5-methyltetrahydropteroyltriglutamate--homocysteine methyltransferase